MCECKEGKCLLDAVFPNQNRGTWACDLECYFTTEDGKRHLAQYKGQFPQEYEKCMGID